jgi:hypothetical protein
MMIKWGIDRNEDIEQGAEEGIMNSERRMRKRKNKRC